MKDVLIVIDMQKDFTTGALKNPAAEKIIDALAAQIRGFVGRVIFTRDTPRRKLSFHDGGKKSARAALH